MTAALIDHIWQSTIFAVAAWLLTLALSRNRAAVRYSVWLAASVKFLLPFSWLVGVGEIAPKHAARGPMVQTEWVVAVEDLGRPLVVPPLLPAVHRDYSSAILWTLWVCGFALVLVSFGRKWMRMRQTARAARPVGLELPIPAKMSGALFEPGVFGIIRPVLLLPEGIAERLGPAQFKAILAHELCHARRRDNLTAMIHMAVNAIFWFHPLVWWIGMRLIAERERACDQEVLRLGCAPQDYAEGILQICKLYVEAPASCVAGVTGSDLRKRIEAIMRNRNVHGLSLGQKGALAAAGMFVVGVPVAVGVLRAQPAPKFEVAAIRPCKGDSGQRRGGNGQLTPGRLSLGCLAVDRIIWTAYVLFANDRYNGFAPDTPVLGAPGWAKSDRYEIEAKAAAPESWTTMSGSMLRALLEDRFKLKMHRETREIPVYALTVAKGGAKLQPYREGTCIARDLGDPEHSPLPRIEPGQPIPLICGMGRLTNDGYDLPGMTMAAFGTAISFELDRPVIDGTGIAGTFDIHLDLSPADLVRPAPDSSDPAPQASIDALAAVESAVEKLGLKLESSKGPGDFLVIDSIERPSEN